MKTHTPKVFFILLLISITVLTTTDLVIDYYEGSDFLHLVVEAIVILFSIGGIAYMIREVILHQRELEQIREQLQQTQHHLSQSREHIRDAGKQYSEVIQKQFEDWQLTPSEKEVATLLLKGLSFDEIASVRNTKEKTVRQQASAIYRKSDLSGRHEFAAWFFEDFLQ